MKPVEDGKDLAARLAAVKGGYTNCQGLLFSLKAGKSPAGLQWEELGPGRFALLEEHSRYYELYLCGDMSRPAEIAPLEKPVLFSHMRGEPPALPGFRFFRDLVRMEKPLAPSGAGLPQGVTLAGPEDWPDVIGLLSSCLDLLDLPTEQDFLTGGRETLLLRRDGILAGVMSYYPEGRQCILSNLAIDPSMRRQGLGEFMMRAAMERGASKGLTHTAFWVNCQNSPSLALQKKLGIRNTGRIYKQFILEPNHAG